jgi:hypothetical protein
MEKAPEQCIGLNGVDELNVDLELARCVWIVPLDRV